MSLSHTARQEFLTCRRKFYLSRVLRLDLDQDPNAIRIGRAFALALEHADPQIGVDALESEISKASAEVVDLLRLQQVQVRVLATEYFKRYGLPGPHTITEHPFESKVLGSGRLDAVHTLTADELVGQEDKLLTKFFFGEAAQQQLQINQQVTAYFAAMREQGTPLKKMEYRVTFKPTIKPNSRKAETLEQYSERLAEKVQDDLDSTFQVFDLYRTDNQMDSFMAQAGTIGRDLSLTKSRAKRVGEAAWYPGADTACTLFGGCKFLDLCSRGQSAIHQYRVKPERVKLTLMQSRITETLSKSLTDTVRTSTLAERVALADSSVYACLRGLERKGIVGKDKIKGKVAWYLTDEGKKI